MKKGTDWLIIGALALGGYLLYRYLKGGVSTDYGTWGGSTQVFVPNIPVPPDGFNPVPMRPVAAQESWTSVDYGTPGQPSIAFKQNTLRAAAPVQGIGRVSPVVTVMGRSKTITIAKPIPLSRGAKLVMIKPTAISNQRAIMAAAAIRANAPPRVVAKIKGGSWF